MYQVTFCCYLVVRKLKQLFVLETDNFELIYVNDANTYTLQRAKSSVEVANGIKTKFG